MPMDINRALRQVVQTGQVHFGVRQAKKALKEKKAKLIVVPENVKEDVLKAFKRQRRAPLVQFKGTNFELGTVCGKPFSVSALTVIDPGESDILDAVSG